MKQNAPKLAIIIPAFNEGEAIAGVLGSIKKTFDRTTQRYEVVVVDDGSRDTTAEVAEKYQVKVIRHIINSGSGGATATGIAYSYQNGFQYAATIDADGQHDPADLIKGIKIIEQGGVDLLIGSRLLGKGDMSTLKMLGNKGLTLITYLLFGIKVTDSQSGLRLYSLRALEQLRWKSNGYEFCSEMLWRAKQKNLTIAEFPIKAIYTDYSKRKGQNNWNAINIIKSMVQRRISEAFGE